MIVSVRGAVVDVVFDGAALPPVNTGLVIEWDRPDPLSPGGRCYSKKCRFIKVVVHAKSIPWVQNGVDHLGPDQFSDLLRSLINYAPPLQSYPIEIAQYPVQALLLIHATTPR